MNFYPFNHSNKQREWSPRPGVTMVLIKHSRGGHYCGYVCYDLSVVPIPEKWQGDYSEDGIDLLNIHGGLTYGEVDREGDVAYATFGFDCMHCGDAKNPDLQDLDHLSKLTEQMDQQLMAMLIRREEIDQCTTQAQKNDIIDQIRSTAVIQEDVSIFALFAAVGRMKDEGLDA